MLVVSRVAMHHSEFSVSGVLAGLTAFSTTPFMVPGIDTMWLVQPVRVFPTEGFEKRRFGQVSMIERSTAWACRLVTVHSKTDTG